MTLAEAKKLTYGQTIYHKTHKNSDGTAQRWRVSGKVQTWKTDPGRIRIPVKHGLYSHDAVTANELSLLTTKEPAKAKKLIKK